MKREAFLSGLAVSLLAGCAPEASKVQSQYVSPELYANYDCRQIGAEFGRLTRRAEELGAVVDKQASDDAAQTFVGLVIFWPALFFLEGGETQQSMEYGRLKGEMEALEKASIEKGCGADIQHLAETVETNPSLVPAGTNPQKLETLKVLYRDGAITEEEYLKRRKELTEAQAKEELALIERQKAAAAAKAASPQPAVPEKLKVAILPFDSPHTTWMTTVQSELANYSQALLERDSTLEVIYDHYGEITNSSKPIRVDAIWPSGFGAKKKPKERQVYDQLTRLDADIGVTYFYGKRVAGWYGEDFNVDIFIYDAASRKIHHQKADESDYKEKIRKLMSTAVSRHRRQ